MTCHHHFITLSKIPEHLCLHPLKQKVAHSKSGSILKIIKEPFGETTTVVHVITTNKKKSRSHSHSATDVMIFASRAAARAQSTRARAHRKHDFYNHSNARKRHVNCAVCRTPSKHRSDYFVYASGAKPRYKLVTLLTQPVNARGLLLCRSLDVY